MELIIKNAKIITMDGNRDDYEAVAVDGGIIRGLGKNDEIMCLSDANTQIIDLKGRLLLPGFNDSHMHLLSYGFGLNRVNLSGSRSVEDIIDRIYGFIKENNIERGKWIQGIGWNQDYFQDKNFPTRYDLDKISGDYPICITRACYHVSVVNSKAMEIMGINSSSSQVEGGSFDVDAMGEPLGIFRENAVRLIYDNIPEPNIEEIKNIIYKASVNALSKGITSIQSDDFEHLPSKDYEKIIAAYNGLIEEGRLKVRINEQCLLPNINRLNDFLSKGYITGKGNEFFRIGPLKLLTDGSLGARTALLTSPYKDAPDTYGIAVYEQEKLDEIIIKAHGEGMQIAVHCIGDRSMYMTFEAFKKAQEKHFRKDARHSIIHCQITDEVLLSKFKKMEIIAHIQPIFLDYDLHIVEERVGTERAKTSYNWKTMLDMGIKIACGSDCPVENFDVLNNIYCAVTRKDLKGYPENGWYPEQKLSVYEAVEGFTKGAAFASFEDDIKGTITIGKMADLVVLSDNIFEIKPENIKAAKVLMTFSGGELVYLNEEVSL